MLRDFSLRDFGASLNTVESYTNESSQGKIGLYEAANKQKCTHLGMFLASGKTVFVDGSGKIIIDETVYNDISQIISTFTGHKRTPKKKFGNAFAKKKRIEQDYRQKEKARNSKKKQSNFLDSIILRLVCNANFPYNFETIQDVTIYDLIYSLKQIDKDIEVTDLMQSRLVGNDLTKIPREQLSRFIL